MEGVKRNIEEDSESSHAADYSSSSIGASKHTKLDITKKFKGVVEQPNGHWGAQIYANHERIWLGTFNSEKDAAMAYDSAAIKLRGGECHRNFPWTKDTFEEPHFQNQYTTEDVLSMIKDGSYQAKFGDFLRTRSRTESVETGQAGFSRVTSTGDGKLSKRLLFQKELTPSDVGKLNRLVIPSKYAAKFFPRISEAIRGNSESGSTQLEFYDRMMRSWTFRFCFWKSSKSFVFTRGWSRFVKTHQLKAKDTITFLQCQRKQLGEKNQEPLSFCMIKINKNGDQDNDVGCLVEKSVHSNINYQYDHVGDVDMSLEQNCKLQALSQTIANEEDEENVKKGFIRLFGVEMGVADAHSHPIIF